MAELRHRLSLRLLHIGWPVALGWSAALVVHRATSRPADPAGVTLLLFGIGAAYSFDRAIDTLGTGAVRLARALMAAAAASMAMTGALLTALPIETAALVPLVGVLALSYPVLKRLPLWKTVVVPLVWTWCAIALPFNDGSWLGWHWLREPVAAPIFLLMAAGCVFCDLKDEARDREAGVASLPAVLGSPSARRIAVAMAVIGGLTAFAQGRLGLTCSALALCGAALQPRLLATDVVGPLLVDAILTLPGVLIAARVI